MASSTMHNGQRTQEMVSDPPHFIINLIVSLIPFIHQKIKQLGALKDPLDVHSDKEAVRRLAHG
jgi:hypothetical protein